LLSLGSVTRSHEIGAGSSIGMKDGLARRLFWGGCGVGDLGLSVWVSWICSLPLCCCKLDVVFVDVADADFWSPDVGSPLVVVDKPEGTSSKSSDSSLSCSFLVLLELGEPGSSELGAVLFAISNLYQPCLLYGLI